MCDVCRCGADPANPVHSRSDVLLISTWNSWQNRAVLVHRLNCSASTLTGCGSGGTADSLLLSLLDPAPYTGTDPLRARTGAPSPCSPELPPSLCSHLRWSLTGWCGSMRVRAPVSAVLQVSRGGPPPLRVTRAPTRKTAARRSFAIKGVISSRGTELSANQRGRCTLTLWEAEQIFHPLSDPNPDFIWDVLILNIQTFYRNLHLSVNKTFLKHWEKLKGRMRIPGHRKRMDKDHCCFRTSSEPVGPS